MERRIKLPHRVVRGLQYRQRPARQPAAHKQVDRRPVKADTAGLVHVRLVSERVDDVVDLDLAVLGADHVVIRVGHDKAAVDEGQVPHRLYLGFVQRQRHILAVVGADDYEAAAVCAPEDGGLLEAAISL